MRKLKIERTANRFVQHLWHGSVYLGSIWHRKVILAPAVAKYSQAIRQMMPPRFAEMPFDVGHPGIEMVEFEENPQAETVAAPEAPVKRGPGRPKGSRNKKTAKKKTKQSVNHE